MQYLLAAFVATLSAKVNNLHHIHCSVLQVVDDDAHRGIGGQLVSRRHAGRELVEPLLPELLGHVPQPTELRDFGVKVEDEGCGFHLLGLTAHIRQEVLERNRALNVGCAEMTGPRAGEGLIAPIPCRRPR